MKLYGFCRLAGECIDGRCSGYPFNKVSAVIIRRTGMMSYTISVPEAEGPIYREWAFGNAQRKRRLVPCPKCGVNLSARHVCRNKT